MAPVHPDAIRTRSHEKSGHPTDPLVGNHLLDQENKNKIPKTYTLNSAFQTHKRIPENHHQNSMSLPSLSA